MRIKQVTDNSIILILPRKQRYLGLVLTILGISLPIFLYLLNNYQLVFPNGSELESLVFYWSLGYFLGHIFIFGIPWIYYFFSIRNIITGFGHILLLALNITAYLGTFSSIFVFLPILITGIYFLTHFRTLEIEKTQRHFHFHDRIFLLFYFRSKIPFLEINEITFEYKNGLEFVSRGTSPHNYNIKLSFSEKDPGFEDDPIYVEEEKDSLEFYRPQTLRQTLISKPTLIDSSFLNFNNYEMLKFNKLIKELLRITEFTQSEKIVEGKKTIQKYQR